MNKIPNPNEQWLLDGICSECRKQSYCKKDCKRHIRRTQSLVSSYIAKRMFEKIIGG